MMFTSSEKTNCGPCMHTPFTIIMTSMRRNFQTLRHTKCNRDHSTNDWPVTIILQPMPMQAMIPW